VLVVDLSTLSVKSDTFIEQIVAQFPDVVVCAAGRREDEPLLAALISEGHVYRFMHMPLSPRRAGMFLQAAIRHHCDRLDDLPPRDPMLNLVATLPRRFDPMKWLFVAVGVAFFVALLSAGFGNQAQAPAGQASPPVAPALPTVTHDVSHAPQADPVLSSARAAFESGRYESPPGRNALDLYKAVLLAHPDNAEAHAGLEKTLDRILASARVALETDRTAEAQRLVDRVLAADPGRQGAVQLAQQMKPAQAVAPAPTDVAAPPSAATAAQPVAASPVVPTAASAPTPITAPPKPLPAPVAARPAPVPVQTVPVPVMGRPVPVPVMERPVPAPVAARPVLTTSLPAPITTRAPQPVAAPVTRLAPVTSLPAAVKLEPKAAPLVVRPDPLAARIVNAPTAPAVSRKPIYGHAVAPLPIAGYEANSGPDSRPPADQPADLSRGAFAPAGPVMPAESFDRLVVTDPVYPLAALRSRTTGWVQMEFTIAPNGSVGDIAVIEAEPKGVFEQAATRALSQWRFRPRVVNGQPVAQRSMLTMRFDVDG
jgi:TonB family protein